MMTHGMAQTKASMMFECSQFGVYLIKAGDTVFKMQITSYYDEEGTSGSYSFRSDALSAE